MRTEKTLLPGSTHRGFVLSSSLRSRHFIGRFLIAVILSFCHGSWPVHANGLQQQQQIDSDYGTCGDCHCIPEEQEACPVELRPEINYDDALLDQWMVNYTLEQDEIVGSNTLTCDPYEKNQTAELYCTTDKIPSIVQAQGDRYVCILELVNETTCVGDNQINHTYRIRNYEGNTLEAQQELLYVTHEGSCGLCSTLQDLVAYIRLGPTARSMATQCGLVGLQQGPLAAIQCFQERAGFTEACSTIWYYNTKNTGALCAQRCAPFFVSDDPVINGPPPICALADCLQCDEDESGPIFRQYAGRTRRNSGLLSQIVRPCSQIVPLTHRDLCEERTLPPTSAPTLTLSPTSVEGDTSGGGMPKALSSILFSLIAVCWVFGLFALDRVFHFWR